MLGRTGLDVSEIGFGTWQLGGISWVSPGEKDCLFLLRHAFESGINLYDVSPSYGNGRSETLVGTAFEADRKDVLISGKVGVLEDGTYHGFWSERQLRESLEQSLRRLKTDYFDILTLHAPPMDVLKAGYALELLHRLKETGMARFIGVSLEAQPEEALIALKQGIDILQIRLNLLFPEARKVFTAAAAKEVGVVINSPFGHGYLSGRYSTYQDIADGDYPKGPFRATKPPELVGAMIRNANAFKELVTNGVSSLASAALKFTLAFKEVSSVVPGHRSMAELQDNLATSKSGPLSAGEVVHAETIYEEIFPNAQRPRRQTTVDARASR